MLSTNGSAILSPQYRNVSILFKMNFYKSLRLIASNKIFDEYFFDKMRATFVIDYSPIYEHLVLVSGSSYFIGKQLKGSISLLADFYRIHTHRKTYRFRSYNTIKLNKIWRNMKGNANIFNRYLVILIFMELNGFRFVHIYLCFIRKYAYCKYEN